MSNMNSFSFVLPTAAAFQRSDFAETFGDGKENKVNELQRNLEASVSGGEGGEPGRPKFPPHFPHLSTVG